MFSGRTRGSSTIRTYSCERCGLRAKLRDFPIGWTLITSLGVLIGFNVVTNDIHPRNALDPPRSLLPLLIPAIAAGVVWLWNIYVLSSYLRFPKAKS